MLSTTLKSFILNSLPYRIFKRLTLIKPEIRFSVEITTKCNCFCQMCTRPCLVKQKKLTVSDMSDQILSRVIAEMKNFSDHGHSVYFCPMGLGEPLLYPHLSDLLKKIKKEVPKVKTVLVTNGVLLNIRNSKLLLSSPVDEISVSLNTNDRQKYKKTMGIDAYDLVKKNIRSYLRLRKKLKKTDQKLFIQYLQFDPDDNFSRDMSKWKKLLSVGDKCYIHPIVNQAGLQKLTSPSSKNHHPCDQPEWRVAVKLNGDIYPCDACFYSGSQKIKSLYLGNIKDNSIFDNFFSQTSKRRRILQKMKANDYQTLPNCQNCTTCLLGTNCYFRNPFCEGQKWL